MADQIDRSTIGLFAMLDFQMYIYFGVESHDDSLCFQIYVGNTVCKISVLVVHLIHVSFLTFNTKRQETVKRISGYQTKEPTQSTKMRRVLTNRLLFKVLCFFAPLSDCPIPPFSQTPSMCICSAGVSHAHCSVLPSLKSRLTLCGSSCASKSGMYGA